MSVLSRHSRGVWESGEGDSVFASHPEDACMHVDPTFLTNNHRKQHICDQTCEGDVGARTAFCISLSTAQEKTSHFAHIDSCHHGRCQQMGQSHTVGTEHMANQMACTADTYGTTCNKLHACKAMPRLPCIKWPCKRMGCTNMPHAHAWGRHSCMGTHATISPWQPCTWTHTLTKDTHNTHTGHTHNNST